MIPKSGKKSKLKLSGSSPSTNVDNGVESKQETRTSRSPRARSKINKDTASTSIVHGIDKFYIFLDGIDDNPTQEGVTPGWI